MSMFTQRWARLYAKMTPPELSMERAVASLGLPYRAQHPEFRAGVILDFALMGPRIAIEVDGRDHSAPAKRVKDAERTARLATLGWRVVRCTNDEALTDPWRALARMLREAGRPTLARVAEAGGFRSEWSVADEDPGE